MGLRKNYLIERRMMVNTQIRSRGISNEKVLNAMLKVPRDRFVSRDERSRSYTDGPLPIGYGQTISQPYIVGYMTALLELAGEEDVLEIGTGSGYQAAILAEIVHHVFTVEVIRELSCRAESLLVGELKYENIFFKVGDGKSGWTDHAPFDRIIITAAAGSFPSQLFPQLKEGGIAVAPIGDYFQRIYRYWKKSGKIKKEQLIGVSFVPLV